MKSARYSSRSPSTPACRPRSTAFASRAKRSPKWTRARGHDGDRVYRVGKHGLSHRAPPHSGKPRCHRLRHSQRGARAHRRPRGTRRIIVQRGRRPSGNGHGKPPGAGGVIEGSRVKRYVDLSTVGSRTAVHIHDLLAERNIVAIDSPVSGGVSGAENGSLAVMVSGPRNEIDIVRTALEAIGRPFYIGEKPGSAQTMKL